MANKSETPQVPSRVTDHITPRGDVLKVADVIGEDCLLHSVTLDVHPEYGESAKCNISLANDELLEDGTLPLYTIFVGGVAGGQLKELIGNNKVRYPLAFRIAKVPGKRYYIVE